MERWLSVCPCARTAGRVAGRVAVSVPSWLSVRVSVCAHSCLSRCPCVRVRAQLAVCLSVCPCGRVRTQLSAEFDLLGLIT